MTTKNHKLYQIWDQVPVDYYQQGIRNNILQKIWHSQKIRGLQDVLKTIEFENCLDVGCASGYMVSEITKSFPKAEYFGIDVYDKAISFARKKYPLIEFKIASAHKIPFKDNLFDLVINYETIEHVEAPAKMLAEIKRVLKPKGTAVVAMDSGNLMFRVIWLIWENSYGRAWKRAHLNPFYHKDLEKLIKSMDFKVKQKKFTHFGLEVVFVLGKKV